MGSIVVFFAPICVGCNERMYLITVKKLPCDHIMCCPCMVQLIGKHNNICSQCNKSFKVIIIEQLSPYILFNIPKSINTFHAVEC